MKKYKIIIPVFLLFCIISYAIFIPKIIEIRLRNCGLMRYDGTTDNFIVKDTVCANSGDLYYILHGTTKDK